GLGCDAVPAADARDMGYPGFAGLGLPQSEGRSEPYIYHFPDGNAALARLLVRALIPGVAPGSTMDDVVLAPFDYGPLDHPPHPVRIRPIPRVSTAPTPTTPAPSATVAAA